MCLPTRPHSTPPLIPSYGPRCLRDKHLGPHMLPHSTDRLLFDLSLSLLLMSLGAPIMSMSLAYCGSDMLRLRPGGVVGQREITSALLYKTPSNMQLSFPEWNLVP
jgi:hypothetical protein